jgi:hypothetical protein
MEPEHRHMPTLHSSFHESEDEEHMVYKATCFGPSAILLYNSFDGTLAKPDSATEMILTTVFKLMYSFSRVSVSDNLGHTLIKDLKYDT